MNDETVRLLAQQVLNGDHMAACALSDRLNDLLGYPTNESERVAVVYSICKSADMDDHNGWVYRNFYRNGAHYLLLERNSWRKEVLVSFSGSGKVQFKDAELYAIADAILTRGEPLNGLLDRLMEWDGWPNAYDRDRFRGQVEEAIRMWMTEEVPLGFGTTGRRGVTGWGLELEKPTGRLHWKCGLRTTTPIRP